MLTCIFLVLALNFCIFCDVHTNVNETCFCIITVLIVISLAFLLMIEQQQPFNGPSSRVSKYHKGKTSLYFTEAKVGDSGICKSAPCDRELTMPAPHQSVYYRCTCCHPANSVKALKATALKLMIETRPIFSAETELTRPIPNLLTNDGI